MTAHESRALEKADARFHAGGLRGPFIAAEREGWAALSWRIEGDYASVSAPIEALFGSFLWNICASFDRLSITVSRLGTDLQALRRDVRQMGDVLRERPVIRLASLSDLGTPDFSLTTPLPIIIEEYPDQVIARWPEIEATGSGSTEPEAIWHLREEVVDLMDDLSSSSPDELGPEPAQALQILRRFIRPNGST